MLVLMGTVISQLVFEIALEWPVSRGAVEGITGGRVRGSKVGGGQ